MARASCLMPGGNTEARRTALVSISRSAKSASALFSTIDDLALLKAHSSASRMTCRSQLACLACTVRRAFKALMKPLELRRSTISGKVQLPIAAVTIPAKEGA